MLIDPYCSEIFDLFGQAALEIIRDRSIKSIEFSYWYRGLDAAFQVDFRVQKSKKILD